MKTISILLALCLPSCESFSKLTPEQQSKILDRGLAVVDLATGAIVGKINPASGQVNAVETNKPAK